MKITAISDMHGILPSKLPSSDLLILGGDECPINNHSLSYQAKWLDTEFRQWLKFQKNYFQNIIGIAGNHSFIFQHPNLIPTDLDWVYLQDTSIEYGLKIYGTPWINMIPNCEPSDWAFMLGEEDLTTKWSLIPDDTDVLVVHGPPFGFGDYIPKQNVYAGSKTLLKRVLQLEQQRLKLCIFGHIHDGYGQRKIGNTIMANVSILDERYQYVNKPSVFEIEIP